MMADSSSTKLFTNSDEKSSIEPTPTRSSKNTQPVEYNGQVLYPPEISKEHISQWLNRLPKLDVTRVTYKTDQQHMMNVCQYESCTDLGDSKTWKAITTYVQNDNLRVWMSHPEVVSAACLPTLHQGEFNLDMQSCALGTMCNPYEFNEHASWNVSLKERSSLKFDFTRDRLQVCLPYPSRDEINCYFRYMKKAFLIQHEDNMPECISFLIHLDHVPVIWTKKRQGSKYIRQRTHSLSGTDSTVIGLCNVFKITVWSTGNAFNEEIHILLDKLQTCNINTWWVNITTAVHSDHSPCHQHIRLLNNTATSWAAKCIISKGFVVLDQLHADDFEKINEHPEAMFDLLPGLLERDLFVDMKDILENIIISLKKTKPSPSKILPNYHRIPHVTVTPTRDIHQPPDFVKLNRVLRQFGPENFITVSFREEDGQKLATIVPNSLTVLTERIKTLLKRGVYADGRHYQFLGCSNSQMRNHGAWLYATDGESDVESIRRWMGDVSQIRCVAVYVSRLGQFFSSSTHALDLREEGISLTTIPDVIRNEFCFTDGVGTVSKKTAKQISDNLKLGRVPSAFQIRVAGCKGVLSVDAALEDQSAICVRPSMTKFQSDHLQLEVMDYTKPHQLQLNRQVITILSQLGVRDESFLQLQDDVFNALIEIFTNNEKACEELNNISKAINFTQLLKSGIDLISDSFFRSLLLERYEEKLYQSLEKTKLLVPFDQGRLLMGIADESNTLQNGEVFVQYSKDLFPSISETCVCVGEIVLAKNPCLHPGDIRKLKAIDVPKLKHLVDCIVFPTNGNRPHPNEMSGSDLDGDMYWVCWYKGLIFPNENQSPMDFPKSEQKLLNHEPTQEDIISYYGDYIKHDQLGAVANAHLVHTDAEEDGIFSERCIKLAEIHSEAVDFSKSGTFPNIDPDLRPKVYPDFMLKSDQSQYASEKILGTLFRNSMYIWKSFMQEVNSLKSSSLFTQENIQLQLVFQQITIDDFYRTAAEESYVDYSTEMQRLLDKYGLSTECDILTRRLNTNTRKRYLKGDVYEANIMTAEVHAIIADFKKRFLQTERLPDLVKKAFSWYEVSYKDGKFKSFAWINHDIIVQQANKCSLQEQPESKPSKDNYDSSASAASIQSVQKNQDMIQNDVIVMFKSHLKKNTIDVFCQLKHIDLSKLNLSTSSIFFVLENDEVQHKSKDMSALVCSMMEFQKGLAVSTVVYENKNVIILNNFIKLCVVHQEHLVEICVCYGSETSTILSKLSKMNDLPHWVQVLTNWFKAKQLLGSSQSISLLHILKLALRFLGQTTCDGDLAVMVLCLQHYSQMDNLRSLHKDNGDLWDLSNQTLRKVHLVITECLHIITIAKSLQCLEYQPGRKEKRLRTKHALSSDATSMFSDHPPQVIQAWQERSGCTVNVKRVPHKQSFFYAIEAFGYERQLRRLDVQIRMYEELAAELRDSSSMSYTRNSQVYIFEGMLSGEGVLHLNYGNKTKSFEVSRKNISWTAEVLSDDMSQFVAWEDNWSLLADRYIYDEEIVGSMRLIVRFSHFSISMQTKESIITANKLIKMSQQSKPWNKSHINDRNTPSNMQQVRIRMKPGQSNFDNVKLFVEREGLEHFEVDFATVCSVLVEDEICSKTPRTGRVVDIIYDDKLSVRWIRNTPIRWSALSYMRHNGHSCENEKSDINIQLQTQRNITDKSDPIYKQFADPDHPVLFLNYDNGGAYSTEFGKLIHMPNIGIMPTFLNKVRFCRQKIIHRFKYSEEVLKQKSDHFTAHVHVYVSHVKEYDINAKHGDTILREFADINIALPVVPSLQHKPECREIMQKTLELAKRISDIYH